MAKPDQPSARADLSADDPKQPQPKHPDQVRADLSRDQAARDQAQLADLSYRRGADVKEDISEATLVVVTVAEGRSIQHQVQVGTQIVNGQTIGVYANRVAMPGQQVKVFAGEVAHLAATGFIRGAALVGLPTPPDGGVGEGEGEAGARRGGADDNYGRTKINGDDGTVVRAGR